jgi:hypothetical protein
MLGLSKKCEGNTKRVGNRIAGDEVPADPGKSLTRFWPGEVNVTPAPRYPTPVPRFNENLILFRNKFLTNET